MSDTKEVIHSLPDPVNGFSHLKPNVYYRIGYPLPKGLKINSFDVKIEESLAIEKTEKEIAAYLNELNETEKAQRARAVKR